MRTLLTQKVKTRKDRQCFACLRKFKAGTKMTTQTVVNDDGDIYTLHYCDTCDQLMANFKDSFLDNDDLFQEGCVSETITEFPVETPEELLGLFNKWESETKKS